MVARSHKVLDLLELVADVEDRAALGPERAERGEEPVDLLRREHRGRLVHDQQLGVLEQAAHDLDALALAHREGVDLARRVERQAVGPAHLPYLAGQRPPLHGVVDAQRHVLQHRHRLEQREVLEHHADAERTRRLRVGDPDGAAVPQDLALVGVEHAVDDLDQRALAGAVLAQQRVDLAGAHLQAHAVVGEHAGEALGDPAQLQAGRGGVVGCHGVAVPTAPARPSASSTSAAVSAAITAGRLSRRRRRRSGRSGGRQ
jgi:hypothetical protein